MIGRVIQLGVSKEIDDVNLKELASKRTTRKEIEVAKRGTIYIECDCAFERQCRSRWENSQSAYLYGRTDSRQ